MKLCVEHQLPMANGLGREGVTIRGSGLSIDDAMKVARARVPLEITQDETVSARVCRAHAYMQRVVADGEIVYGVTTGFGGMANVVISAQQSEELQDNMLWYHKTGAGRFLPVADVRAAMLLRANSHLRGASGLRMDLVERLVTFINASVTPQVPELGSIGASGDLVPLAYITGALIGHAAGYRVDFDGREMDAAEALARLGLPRMNLQPKEALAMLNGTSVSTAIAAGCIYDARILLDVSLQAHGLMLQGLHATNQSFASFIHEHKPHPGQLWCAGRMRELLQGSQLVRNADSGNRNPASGLVQDRYSLRCLPQFIGPIADAISRAGEQIEVEMNSATDNPLIDSEAEAVYYGGNFLAQYTSAAMDQVRHALGLLAKHLDVQIAQLVAPEFSNGLPASLVGNRARQVNMGLKGLQIAANSIAPLIEFFGTSLAERFPTHAEQFNQNVNSQAFGSANLTRQSIDLMRQHLAISLLFGVQAVDLRTYALAGHYDARRMLSPAQIPLYNAVLELTGTSPSETRPWLRDDNERVLDRDIAAVYEDLVTGGSIARAITAPAQGSRVASSQTLRDKPQMQPL